MRVLIVMVFVGIAQSVSAQSDDLALTVDHAEGPLAGDDARAREARRVQLRRALEGLDDEQAAFRRAHPRPRRFTRTGAVLLTLGLLGVGATLAAGIWQDRQCEPTEMMALGDIMALPTPFVDCSANVRRTRMIYGVGMGFGISISLTGILLLINGRLRRMVLEEDFELRRRDLHRQLDWLRQGY